MQLGVQPPPQSPQGKRGPKANVDPMPRSFTSASVKNMAAVPVVSTAHLHFNDVFLSTYGHLLSYASLTTLLINSTMEGTPSGIKSRYRRQVNKGDLEIALLHVKTPYHKAIWTRKSTSCPFRQSYVHNNEITRDLTALSCSQIS